MIEEFRIFGRRTFHNPPRPCHYLQANAIVSLNSVTPGSYTDSRHRMGSTDRNVQVVGQYGWYQLIRLQFFDQIFPDYSSIDRTGFLLFIDLKLRVQRGHIQKDTSLIQRLTALTMSCGA